MLQWEKREQQEYKRQGRAVDITILVGVVGLINELKRRLEPRLEVQWPATSLLSGQK
jgi:hypothetical protein